MEDTAWRHLLPTDAKFHIVRHDTDGRGGGSFLFEAQDPQRSGGWPLRAETVIIPRHLRPWEEHEDDSRGAAVCVSSQAGCPLDCRFCDSGKVKPAANLPSWAILAQIWAARQTYPVQRVVFMGMGEPLLNYSEVSSVIRQLHEDNIFSRPWAITVSTVGVAPKIRSLAHDHPKVALAVSLHAPSQALRQQLLPGSAARWPLETVLEAVTYHQETVGRVPMFAYTLLPGVNDSEEHAKELVELLQRTPGSPRSFINLVPYNATSAGEEAGFVVPSQKQLRDFRSLLRSLGFRATVRWSTTEGRVLGAACGQLTAREHATSRQQEPAESPNPSGDAALLTWRMYRASAAELLQLIAQNASELNSIHVSAAFVTLARSNKKGPGQAYTGSEAFQLLLHRTQELPDLSAQSCANIIWSLAKLRYKPGPALLDTLLDSAERELQNFWPRNLANTFWGLARLQCSEGSAKFCPQAVQKLGSVVSQMTPVELSNSLWAVARLRVAADGATLDAVVDCSLLTFARWKPQDIANALWAFSVLQYKPASHFQNAIASRSEQTLSDFKADELAMCVRSFARISGCSSGGTFLAKAAERLGQNAKDLRTERVADAVLAFAELTVQLEATSSLLSRWAGRPASLAPKALLLRLDTLARMGVQVPEDAQDAWHDAVRVQLPKLSSGEQERGSQFSAAIPLNGKAQRLRHGQHLDFAQSMGSGCQRNRPTNEHMKSKLPRIAGTSYHLAAHDCWW